MNKKIPKKKYVTNKVEYTFIDYILSILKINIINSNILFN